MKRRKREQEDSLELMLDTICNTFGGIVFLALLVCILSRNVVHNRKSQSDVDQERLEYAQVASRLKKLVAEDEQLTSSLAQQQQLLEAFAGQGRTSEDTSKLLEEIRGLQDRISGVDKAIATAKREQSSLDAEQADAAKAVAALKSDLQGQNAAIEEKAKREVIRMRTPMARTTFKREVPILLLGGKIYQPVRYDSSGFPLGEAPEYAGAMLDDQLSVAEIKRGQGVAAGDEAGVTAWRRQFTRVLSSDRHYICLAVWPDSYDEFVRVRNDLVDQGFEYRLLLIDKDEPVVFGSNTGGQVQ